MNYGQGRNGGYLEIYRELRLPSPTPPPPFWMLKKIFYFILLNYIHHLQKQLTLHIIKCINVFSDKPDSLSLVSLLNGRLDFNREIIKFQLLFLFYFVLGSVFHEDKVSSLNKFEGDFAQSHSL